MPPNDSTSALHDAAATLEVVQRALDELVPPALLRHFHDSLRERVLEPGERLIRQGEPGDDLYVVLEGHLAISVANADGSETGVDEVGPGGVVGEMALLTRQARSASVTARTHARVLAISHAAFEQVAAGDPAAVHGFMRRVLHRLRRSQMVQLLTEIFGPLHEHALRDLEHTLEWVFLRSGERLLAQGERSDDVYLVVNGRLRVTRLDADGREVVLEEIGRAAAVGEVALLTGEPRSATVDAIRDSHLLRLSRARFDALVERQPHAMMQIARAAVWRLRETAMHKRTARTSTFALVPAHPDVPLADLVERIARVLRTFGTVAVFDARAVDAALGNPGVANAAEGTVVNEALTAWLSAQEREHAFMLLVADATATAWTKRCVLQADRILTVADATLHADVGVLEQSTHEIAPNRRRELVLLHRDATSAPAGTARWLKHRTVAAHHHVRLGREADVARLARRITGRALGLTLGGGGARGFAHIGALRALAEAGITVDVFGGTSIGALIAAGAAVGLSLDEMQELAATFASRRKLLDRTLPITALMAGAKVTALYRRMFAEQRIEDLWQPYFAISSGLSRAVPVVHETGLLWRAVRASTAIPAIFPPLLGEDDEVHVDGGVMNNMPLDVMRTWCEAGTVIGVNPMPTHDRLRAYHFGPSLSGWQALLGRFKLFGSRVRAPSILGSVMRATEINSANRMRQPSFRALADLLIEPPVGGFPILAFERHAEIIDIGYDAARKAIADWQESAHAA